MVDEDIPVFPDSWLTSLHPRRGGVSAPPVTLDEDAVAWARAVCIELQADVEEALRHPDSDPVLTAALRRRLDGAADPLGAAVQALFLTRRGRWYADSREWTRVVDWWVAEHGLPFAAHACAETFRLQGSDRGEPIQCLKFIAPGEEFPAHLGLEYGAARVRRLLAAAGEEEHRRAVERLAGCREHPAQRIAVSFLVPDQRAWVDECCQDPPVHEPLVKMLWCSLSSPDQLADFRTRDRLAWWRYDLDLLITVADGLRAAAVPLLTAAAEGHLGPEAFQRIFALLAALPCDEAMEALVERLGRPYAHTALRQAALNHPVRAMRLLAPRLARAQAYPTGEMTPDAHTVVAVRDVLLTCLRERPGLAGALPELPAAARAVVRTLAAEAERAPTAPVEELPPVLADPPWRSADRGGRRAGRKAGRVAKVAGLEPPAERRVVWGPGEREAWHLTAGTNLDLEPGLRAASDGPPAGAPEPPFTPVRLLLCPAEQAGPALRDWTPGMEETWAFSDWAKSMVARFEADALPIALSAAELGPDFLEALLPLRSAETARLMASRLTNGVQKSRRVVLDWFARHGTEAVPLLVPDAVGDAEPKLRRPAQAALRLLASRHGDEEVAAAARVHGEEAAEAVRALLAADPLARGRQPKIPEWADPASLPDLLLRDRRRALPEQAVRDLLMMLAKSRPGTLHPGLAQVAEACDPRSLAEFGWALFRRWEASAAQPTHRWPAPQTGRWALHQLAWSGDAEIARRLALVIHRWSLEGEQALVLNGLEVLAEFDTAEALTRLQVLGRRLRKKTFVRAAEKHAAKAAERLGLAPGQVPDAPPPDFGLDADGTLTLDYGPRRFTVVFDSRLIAHVVDQSGRRRKTLPKPAAGDDPELAAEARGRLTKLRKETAAFAAEQTGRLERAMREGRRWSAEEFEAFVRHPLLWHIAARLVWIVEPPAGETAGEPVAFRLAEDRTLADVHDELYELPPDARVGVCHPVELGPSLKAWQEVFDDYQIIQPFPQLHRTVHALTDTERRTGVLDRSRFGPDVRISEPKLYARGWTKNHGTEDNALRHLPGGLVLLLHLTDLTVHHVDLRPHPIEGIKPGFGPLDPLTETLLLEDLLEATAAD